MITTMKLRDCMSTVKGYSLKYNIFYIVTWMSINQLLKLNTEKTELIVISSSRQAQPIFEPSDSVRNIGVIFDRTYIKYVSSY